MMVKLDLLDHLVLLEKEACLECLEYLDQRDIEGFLDWMEPKGHLDLLEKREKMALQGLLVLLDPLDLLVSEERGAEMAPLDHLD